MVHAIAFFPWVALDKVIEVGPIRLIPYERKVAPGDLPNVAQNDMDGILAAYALRPKIRIRTAALLEHADWHLGKDPTPVLESLFAAREQVAMSALAARRFFRGHSNYCNTDQYAVVVQRYRPGDTGDFAFTARRRDGHSQYLWGSDEFAFHCPNHVTPSRPDLDEGLLKALVSKPVPNHLRHSIVEFLSANTDAPGIPETAEVVMTKCAFEFLFEIGHTDDELEDALIEAFVPFRSGHVNGPLAPAWKKRWPKADSPLGAWAREFNVIRGTSAHGAPRGKAKTVWPAHAHLLFAAVLFPLLLKAKLHKLGRLVMKPRDAALLSRIEQLLMHQPFDEKHFAQNAEHPWPEIENQAVWDVAKADMRKVIEKALG